MLRLWRFIRDIDGFSRPLDAGGHHDCNRADDGRADGCVAGLADSKKKRDTLMDQTTRGTGTPGMFTRTRQSSSKVVM